MSCSCLQTPCCCGVNVYVTPPCGTDCPPNASNTFQNNNLAGIGVFDNVTNGLVSFRGIEGDGEFIGVTLDATNHAVKLSVLGGVIVGQTFVNAAARAAAVPSFVGQLGVEQDTLTPYLSNGTTAGDWQASFLTNGVNNALTANTVFVVNAGGTKLFEISDGVGNSVIFGDSTAFFDINGSSNFNGAVVFNAQTQVEDAVLEIGSSSTLQVDSGGAVNMVTGSLLKNNGVTIPANSVLTTSGVAGHLSSALLSGFVISGATNVLATATTLEFQSGASATFDSGATLNVSGLAEVKTGGQVKFDNGGFIDFENGSLIKLGGTSILANKILITSGTAGQLTFIDPNQFISTFNQQTGYAAFTNPAVLRTCNTSTVTLQQLAQLVGTLISDLKSVLLPAT